MILKSSTYLLEAYKKLQLVENNQQYKEEANEIKQKLRNIEREIIEIDLFIKKGNKDELINSFCLQKDRIDQIVEKMKMQSIKEE